jgi:hypothetical protein
MKPSEMKLQDKAPERALISSRTDVQDAVLIALGLAERSVRCLHRDLTVFDLGSVAAEQRMAKLLLAHRASRIRLLVDDATWLENAAPRLRGLQRRYSHALEMRIAAADDPVGDDACLIVDDHGAIELKPTAAPRGDFWLRNKPHVQPLAMAFERRWNAAGHNMAVVPLGLG